jgi:hypothetical protein
MVKKVKGLKVGKNLQEKFKFTQDGESQIGTDESDTHSLLGETNIANDTTVDGQLYFQQRIADALFGAPQLSGTFDEARLQEMVDNAAAKYEGFMFYLTDESSIQPFSIPQKFYFCEDGAWHPSPFVKEEYDSDGDGIADTEDPFIVDMFDDTVMNTTNLENDTMFELDDEGDVMLQDTLSQPNGNFELDNQGDVMPAAN